MEKILENHLFLDFDFFYMWFIIKCNRSIWCRCEMERESQETVDFISDIENQETEPEILADDEQLSESEQIVESEKEPENPVEIEDSSDQITDLDAPEQMSVQSLEEELLAVAENGEEASTDRVAYVDVNGNPIAEAPSVIKFGAIADHKELSIEGRHGLMILMFFVLAVSMVGLVFFKGINKKN